MFPQKPHVQRMVVAGLYRQGIFIPYFQIYVMYCVGRGKHKTFLNEMTYGEITVVQYLPSEVGLKPHLLM